MKLNGNTGIINAMIVSIEGKPGVLLHVDVTNLDIDAGNPDVETTVMKYLAGCLQEATELHNIKNEIYCLIVLQRHLSIKSGHYVANLDPNGILKVEKRGDDEHD